MVSLTRSANLSWNAQLRLGRVWRGEGIDQLATCTCAGAPGLSGVPGRMTRYCFAEGSLLSTICRIGPMALTIAAPAGLVMKVVSGCNGSLQSGFGERART